MSRARAAAECGLSRRHLQRLLARYREGGLEARKRSLAFVDDHRVTVAELTTGEVLSTHVIEPSKA